METWQSFDTNPLYALLHEPIYCEGYASQWSAQRTLRQPEVRHNVSQHVKLRHHTPHPHERWTASLEPPSVVQPHSAYCLMIIGMQGESSACVRT